MKLKRFLMLLRVTLFIFSFIILSNCGGGGVVADAKDSAKDLPETVIYSAKVAEPYSKKVDINSSLIDAPEGMSLNPKTGLISWTPTPNQSGEFTFKVKYKDAVKSYKIRVKKSDLNLSNTIFISVNGNNDNNGSYDAPLENTKKLCKNINEEHPDLIIYFRGGVYHNPGFGKGLKNNPSIPQIKCSGSKGHRVQIKPWGNERGY